MISLLTLCAECGQRIAAKRLQAIPSARYCIGCQHERDVLMTASDLPDVLAVPGDIDPEMVPVLVCSGST